MNRWNILVCATGVALSATLPLSQSIVPTVSAADDERRVFDLLKGRHLFERETFGGNGRTCLTCTVARRGCRP